MTTFINFAPSGTASPPFQFDATLDGQQYLVTTTWNLFGRRWYINVFAADGTLIATKALIASQTGLSIQSLTWDIVRQVVTVTTANPHGFKVGRTVELTIAGCVPIAYNGIFDCLATGPNSFTYPMASDPGAATVFGAATYSVNMVGGYFATSSIVFREASSQFEIAP